jgi:hypothetical protein
MGRDRTPAASTTRNLTLTAHTGGGQARSVGSVVPYADGGETSTSNIQLRCRMHNGYEAELWSGAQRLPQAKEARANCGAT